MESCTIMKFLINFLEDKKIDEVKKEEGTHAAAEQRKL